MKSIRWVVSLLAVSACSRGTNFDLGLKGTLQGQPVDVKVHVETEHPTDGTLSTDVHFLTDGSVQQFAVAAFAQGECAVAKTCNTYR